ncbi:3911_t:CDS:2 [Entrophospora sp. SA101]|nr:55_t:CDS:2 [Entrophospora sp. SA101]CAJ0754076.1 3911_t:CDS:2 [Entrophospora sp. SA101]CAJ0877676.1 3944_t:CDS:2 [Entrophospora sp. SA101]CAJ0916657.1 18932_t:CDS:2 [Entrophospora sp. SA101]
MENKQQSEGPFLAMFPGIPPPMDLNFQVYKKSDSVIFQECIVTSQNERVNYEARNSEKMDNDQSNNDYMIAIYNKKTKTITFKEIPVISFKATPKRIKLEKEKKPDIPKDYATARKALDLEFSTKKRQSQINAIQRGKIDVSQMEGIENFVEVVGEKVKTILIPPYNLEATKLNEVYNLEDILTKEEFELLNIDFILSIKNNNQVLEHLSFKSFAHSSINNQDIMSKNLNNPPRKILEGLYERYTEKLYKKQGGAPRFKFTTKSENKLLCWMFTLCLMLDGYRVETEALVQDLLLTKTK